MKGWNWGEIITNKISLSLNINQNLCSGHQQQDGCWPLVLTINPVIQQVNCCDTCDLISFLSNVSLSTRMNMSWVALYLAEWNNKQTWILFQNTHDSKLANVICFNVRLMMHRSVSVLNSTRTLPESFISALLMQRMSVFDILVIPFLLWCMADFRLMPSCKSIWCIYQERDVLGEKIS